MFMGLKGDLLLVPKKNQPTSPGRLFCGYLCVSAVLVNYLFQDYLHMQDL